MAGVITQTASLNILAVDDASGNTKNNISPLVSMDGLVTIQGELVSVSSPTSITLPTSPIYNLYVKNLHATNYLMVVGFIALSGGIGGAPNIVLAVLSPGGFISSFNSSNAVGTPITFVGLAYVAGYTGITLIPSAANTTVEYFIGA